MLLAIKPRQALAQVRLRPLALMEGVPAIGMEQSILTRGAIATARLDLEPLPRTPTRVAVAS